MNTVPNDKTTVGTEHTARLKRLLQVEKKLSPQMRAKMEVEAKFFIDSLTSVNGNWTPGDLDTLPSQAKVAKKE
jgi:hypothetical protein